MRRTRRTAKPGWRGLKAAREAREAKEAIEAASLARNAMWQARNERDAAIRAPLYNIKKEAMERLTHFTADALERCVNGAVKAALEQVQDTSLMNAEVSASDRFDINDRIMIFRIRVPEQDYRFASDVRALVPR